jgi:hypothetical protein
MIEISEKLNFIVFRDVEFKVQHYTISVVLPDSVGIFTIIKIVVPPTNILFSSFNFLESLKAD